jgi:hypothetical protein
MGHRVNSFRFFYQHLNYPSSEFVILLFCLLLLFWEKC